MSKYKNHLRYNKQNGKLELFHTDDYNSIIKSFSVPTVLHEYIPKKSAMRRRHALKELQPKIAVNALGKILKTYRQHSTADSYNLIKRDIQWVLKQNELVFSDFFDGNYNLKAGRKSKSKSKSPRRRKSAPKRKSGKKASPKRKSKSKSSSKTKSPRRAGTTPRSPKRKSKSKSPKKASPRKSCTKSKWKLEGHSKVYSYPWSGCKTTGMLAEEIKKMYMKVGRAWEKHSGKNRDLGSAKTTEQMKKVLKYFFSTKGERDWIEYALSGSKYDLLKSGKTRLVKVI